MLMLMDITLCQTMKVMKLLTKYMEEKEKLIADVKIPEEEKLIADVKIAKRRNT